MSLITESQIIIDDMPVEVVEEHQPEQPNQETTEIVITFDSKIPGVPEQFVKEIEMEPDLVVEDDEDKKEEEDENDASTKSKKNEKWDWESKGASGFLAWVNERFKKVPGHTGKDTAGLERAIAYLNKLDSEISKAMRNDVDEELDSLRVEDIRNKIEDGVDALEERLQQIKKSKKRKKKASEDDDLIVKESEEEESEEIIKTAKSVPLYGNYVNVPMLIASLARLCINGTVSAGHSLQDIFEKVSKKYNLDNREEYQLATLIQDMGYPINADRFYILDDKIDPTESEGVEYATNYPA